MEGPVPLGGQQPSALGKACQKKPLKVAGTLWSWATMSQGKAGTITDKAMKSGTKLKTSLFLLLFFPVSGEEQKSL